MATKKIYIGPFGPALFDDTLGINDQDGDFSGETRHAMVTDGGSVLEFVNVNTLRLRDSDESNILSISWDEDDSADRTLQLLVGGGNRSLTLNENFTIGDGYAGTLTFGSACTLTVELASILNQDLTTDASPSFANLSLGTGELTAGSINRATGTLTLEIAGNAVISIAAASVTVAQTLVLSTCAAAGVDTDKFLVLDGSNNVDYRTGAQVLSDIGGAASTHASQHGVGQADTVFPADPDADKVLMWDDDPGALVWSAAGTGDVTAAANITDHRVVRGDGGAKGIQESLVTIDDSGNIIIPNASNVGSVGDTDAIAISAAGILAFSGQSGIEINLSANQDIPNSVWTQVIFDEEIEDIQNEHNTTTGYFTATTAGRYLVGVLIVFAENISDGLWGGAAVYKNDALHLYLIKSYVSVASNPIACGMIKMTLAASDTLKIMVFHGHTEARQILADYCRFYVHKLA